MGTTLGLSGCGGGGNNSSAPPPPTPSITSLSPTSSPIGSAVTITGINFGAAQSTSTVTFNGTSATPTSWSATSIVVPVPAGAMTGNVVVTVDGVSSAGVAFTVLQPPSISSVSPSSAAAGVPVTITGTNFGATQGTSTVTFNGTPATPTSWSATSIVVPVPAGATTGNVVVTVSNLASGGAAFTVLPTPAISNLYPSSAAVGIPVSITGTNFGATRGTSTVTFNGTSATPTSWSATSIVVPVPAGATTGSVVVTVNGIGSAGVNFTVAPVSVSPQFTAVVVTTQTQQFAASVMGGGSVTWSVDSIAGGNSTVGTISTNGLYTPPSTAGTHTITATSVANSADSGSASVSVTDLAGVYTHHNDLARDGTNTQEYGLNPATVNINTFGKLFSCAVDGDVFGQPLWVPSLSINGGIHNVIFVATQHDTVFAFDADANPCVQYWQGTGSLGEVNLLDATHGGTTGETSVFWDDVGSGSGDIYPEVGVTGTPVIDPTTNTMYLVSTSQNSSQGTFYQRLHALDLATGDEKFSAPVNIAASVAGVGDGSSGGMVSFNAQMENQRPALALAGGTVYLGWSAHEDVSPWHGWFLGYSASDVQQQVAVFNTSPNGGAGGIWAGGGAPAVDSDGNIYVSTGNGAFDANNTTTPDNDYGDSILKLIPATGSTANGENLSLVDWFTPDNQNYLSEDDIDLGSGNAMLLPDQTSGPVLHLLVVIGKQGFAYLIDRDNMGHYLAGSNQVVQSFAATSTGFYGTPAFWQNGLYFAGSLDNPGRGDYLKVFSFNPSTGQFDTIPASESSHFYNFPGASPSVSSQGTANGIVWAIDASAYGFANPNAEGTNCFQVPVPAVCSGPAVLHAYDAGNLAIEYWNSSMAANNRDQAGNAVKFVPPTVANGKVYVGTRTEVDVYGLSP
ncbi:MAG: IPT/TIG domain-containing protein [Candidatus Sulfotelmatobacter sp.]